MKFNALTLALHNFIAIFSGGATRMSGYANSLLYSLAAIDIVLLGLWWALDGGERLSGIFKRILYFGFWIWMVRSFPTLAKTFVDSLVKAGQVAGVDFPGPDLVLRDCSPADPEQVGQLLLAPAQREPPGLDVRADGPAHVGA